MTLSDGQIERYARHIILAEVGGIGQEKLLASRALVIGAGGLGAPLILYLAAAGIGTIGVVDDDQVSLSNLQRQIIHNSENIGMGKVESATLGARAVNPEVIIEAHPARLSADNALDLIAGYDIIADGSDNFATRYLLNDACFLAKKTLISAAVLRFDGQLSTYKAHLGGGHPCYRCLFPEAPPDGIVPSCSEAGVMGALVGVMGSLQATEVVKEILGIGTSLSGRLMMYDGLAAEFHEVKLRKFAKCRLCSEDPEILDLSAHN